MKSRDVLKSNWRAITNTDREKGIEKPEVEKTCEGVILLPKFDLGHKSFFQTIKERKSIRRFSNEALSLKELSFLLWTSYGVRKYVETRKVVFRTVPSAGATHPFDVYVMVFNVKGLDAGIYRYSGLKHGLCKVKLGDFRKSIVDATLGQKFVRESAVVFVLVAVPYRTEWKYKQESYKTIAIDAGHVCQNIYLASTSIDCGTCAIAAYDQEKMDGLIGVDGNEEFVVYFAPIGKLT
ncbi:nitroreductase [Thermosipho melanesiensis]|uniref:Nitroreductase n=2 Tax=Thermosipho melanesiensis TaxID=46541 RepID=A6LLF3_THEM4|nr:SagB/ThcOx family dehydrogenase [Thermosipho melanesiensis]ABR30754.1 nitroreductase [Thermosipho melanesiensis BI429]APT73877.1 nitroreductase [Thermosipho melanesiensis]OOC35818.1 nitroreductase [Thermosipho melanesiensis]OOC38320.1 nitroreductase [Thermosipho melanesiensis]OOC38781.1 nitroreductase [Thermosipho melanesiensis]